MEIGSFSAFKVAACEKVDLGQTWTDELHHNGLKIILKGRELSDNGITYLQSKKKKKKKKKQKKKKKKKKKKMSICALASKKVVESKN